MALKAVLTATEFAALSEPLREHYAGADHDTYVLDADIDSHPKVSGLKSAYEKAKKAKKDGDDEFRKLRDQIGDMDPEKAREALTRVQEMADKKLLDEGKVDELIKARTDAMAKAHAAEKAAYDQRVRDLEQTNHSLDTELTSRILNGSIVEQAIKSSVKKEYLDDVLYRLKEGKGTDGVKWTLNDERQVVAMQGDALKYGKDAQPMTIGEGIEMLRKSAPAFFEPSSGGGASNNYSRADGQPYAISESDAGDIGKWRAAKAAADKAGQQLTIVKAS